MSQKNDVRAVLFQTFKIMLNKHSKTVASCLWFYIFINGEYFAPALSALLELLD